MKALFVSWLVTVCLVSAVFIKLSSYSRRKDIPALPPERYDIGSVGRWAPPPEIQELEKKYGVAIEYLSGREAFVKYGAEYFDYAPKANVMVWTDSLPELIRKFEARWRYNEQEKSLKHVEIEKEKREREQRAKEWDAKHSGGLEKPHFVDESTH